MSRSIDIEPQTVADLMNPENPNNPLDLSGRGVDWDPTEVLAAANLTPGVSNKAGRGEILAAKEHDGKPQ